MLGNFAKLNSPPQLCHANNIIIIIKTLNKGFNNNIISMTKLRKAFKALYPALVSCGD